ncbi:hypothetical protein L1785_07725 [Antribacter sp. KLBMP9083]|uniref:Uncharacterized protein n=1 Tax=Antribacter soli TaxID=2910976 RepID=A0AA41QD05_9MICO|nr:hypothetical protein [Antribacter soli]MCF4120866.1 hypothetical protein [Antribacter soli]
MVTSTPPEDPADAATEIFSSAGPRHATPRKRTWAKPLTDLRASVQAQLGRLDVPGSIDDAFAGSPDVGPAAPDTRGWSAEDVASLASSALSLADTAASEACAARAEAGAAAMAAEAARMETMTARSEMSAAYGAAAAAQAEAAAARAEVDALHAELDTLHATTARNATIAWSAAGGAALLAVVSLVIALI